MKISELLKEKPIQEIKEKILKLAEKYNEYAKFGIEDPLENIHYLDAFFKIQEIKKHFKNINSTEYDYEIEKDDFDHMKKYSMENFIDKEIDVLDNGRKARKNTKQLINELYEDSKSFYGKKYDEYLTEILATLQVENIMHESGFPIPEDFINKLVYHKIDGRKKSINNMVDDLENILHYTLRNSDTNMNFSTLLDFIENDEEMNLMFNFYVEVKPKRNKDLRRYGDDEYKGLGLHFLNDLENFVNEKINEIEKNINAIEDINNLKIDFSNMHNEDLIEFYEGLDKSKKIKMLNQIQYSENLAKLYSKIDDKYFFQKNLKLNDENYGLFFNSLIRKDKESFYKNIDKKELKKLFDNLENKNELINFIKSDLDEKFTNIFESYLISKNKADVFVKYPKLSEKIFNKQYKSRIECFLNVKNVEEYKKEFKYWDIIENNLEDFGFSNLKNKYDFEVDYSNLKIKEEYDPKQIKINSHALYGALFDFKTNLNFYNLMNKACHEYNQALNEIKELSSKISKEVKDELYPSLLDKAKSLYKEADVEKKKKIIETILEKHNNEKNFKYLNYNENIEYDKIKIMEDVIYSVFDLEKDIKEGLNQAFAYSEYPYAIMFIDQENAKIDNYFLKDPKVLEDITIKSNISEMKIGEITDARFRVVDRFAKVFDIKDFDVYHFLKVHEK